TTNAVNGLATFSNLTVDRTGAYTLVASSSPFADVTSSTFNVTGTPLIGVGAVTPDRVLSPTAGFVMRDTGRSFTVDVTIVDPGSSASGTGTMVIGTTTTGGASVITFQTAGSSGVCITNCTGSPTWSATNLTGGITFTHTSGVRPL